MLLIEAKNSEKVCKINKSLSNELNLELDALDDKNQGKGSKLKNYFHPVGKIS